MNKRIITLIIALAAMTAGAQEKQSKIGYVALSNIDNYITIDTATVSGYHCQKATCRYHGRDFEAWFTTEVPVKFGPWKFGGLPGLIVKVYDTDHLYTFECTNVERVRRPMVRSQYARRKPIKRETVLKLERKINENPAKTLGWKDMDGNALSKVYPYEPLELE